MKYYVLTFEDGEEVFNTKAEALTFVNESSIEQFALYEYNNFNCSCKQIM